MEVSKNQVIWILGTSLSYIISIFLSSFSHDLVFQDFNEIIRPLIWFSAIALFSNLEDSKIYRINITMAAITSSIVVFQLLYKEHFSFVYYLYSNQNLYTQTRPAGFFYTHTELPLFQLLGIYSIFKLHSKINLKNIFLILLLFLGATIGQSKSGLLMLSIFLIGALIVRRREIKLAYKIVFLATFVGMIVLILNRFGYLYYGFLDLLKMRTGNASIGNRIEDIQLLKSSLIDSPIKIIFGNGPLRGYPEMSYIEITFINVLFRFGLVGLFLYYLPLLRKYIFSPSLDKILIFSILVGDLTSNMSETLKAFPLILATLYSWRKEN